MEDFTAFKKRKYCNRECMRKAYLKIGKNNQTFSNAHTTARNINKLILHKNKCEVCGSTINLDIHHKDGNWKNNNLENLMCLCRTCHTKYEKNKNAKVCIIFFIHNPLNPFIEMLKNYLTFSKNLCII